MLICLSLFSTDISDILTLQSEGNMTNACYFLSALIMPPAQEGCCNMAIPALFGKEVQYSDIWKKQRCTLQFYYIHSSQMESIKSSYKQEVKSQEPSGFFCGTCFPGSLCAHITTVEQLQRYTLVRKTWAIFSNALAEQWQSFHIDPKIFLVHTY